MAEPFVLRPLEEADLDAAAAIEAAAGLPARSPEARRAELADPRTHTVVLEAGGAIACVGSLWLAPDAAHVTSLAVAAEARRRGHGRRLTHALVALALSLEAEAVTLECRVSNVAARALYRGCGFEEAGERRRYYADGEDAVIMTRRLDAFGAGG